MGLAEIDGLSVGIITAGALFAYVGVKGYSVPHALQAFISGTKPTGPADQPIATPQGSTTSGGAGPGGGSGTPQAVLANTGSFARDVLSGIGAPASTANLSSLEAWVAREGGGGANNPLNTTLPMPGSTPLAGNSAGVQNYPDAATGVQATVATLLGGDYEDLIMAFRSGAGLCGRSWNGLFIWSGSKPGVSYSSVC